MGKSSFAVLLIILGAILLLYGANVLPSPLATQTPNVRIIATLNGQPVKALVVIYSGYKEGHKLISWGYSPYETYLRGGAETGYWVTCKYLAEKDEQLVTYGGSWYITPKATTAMQVYTFELKRVGGADVSTWMNPPTPTEDSPPLRHDENLDTYVKTESPPPPGMEQEQAVEPATVQPSPNTTMWSITGAALLIAGIYLATKRKQG